MEIDGTIVNEYLQETIEDDITILLADINGHLGE